MKNDSGAVHRILIFIVLYGFIDTLSESVSNFLQIPHLISCICIPVYLLAVLKFLHKEEKLEQYGICPVREIRHALFLTAPLILLPICNALGFPDASAGENAAPLPLVPDIILTCASAFAEELLFRGVLPIVIGKRYSLHKAAAAIRTNLLFAFLHFSNFFSNKNFKICCLQAIFVFSVGFSLSALTSNTASIFPAVIIHILINLTAAKMISDYNTVTFEKWYLLLIVSLLSFGYGLWLYHKEKKRGCANETIH